MIEKIVVDLECIVGGDDWEETIKDIIQEEFERELRKIVRTAARDLMTDGITQAMVECKPAMMSRVRAALEAEFSK